MPIALVAGSPSYPKKLLDLADAPLEIYATAPLPTARAWIGVVGSRQASERGREIARSMARDFVRSGVGVISGGALGIDAAAHRGALDGGGQTIVVLPSPITAPLPRRNRALFADVIARGGVLISELSSSPVHRSAFMMRNRIIAALSDAVVVVEAQAQSGTRHTVEAAIRLGRPLAGVRWLEGDPRGGGTEQIERSGGRTVSGAREVLSLIGFVPSELETTDPVLAAIGGGCPVIDRLVRAAGLPIPDLLAKLSMLELDGQVRFLPGGRVERLR